MHVEEIDVELVRALLRDQHPDLADRPLALAARGWDNQLWRLGADLAVRLPWATAAADDLLRKEGTWVPRLAPRLPLPVPVPQRVGEPSARFPRPWLVTTWVPGAPADQAPITDGGSATVLAGFLDALHRPAPPDAPGSRDRGGPLADLDDRMRAWLAADADLLPDPDRIVAIWADAVAAGPDDRPPVWLHGDLHPANVLTTGGALTGVIDFGDLCAGDRALDLASAWILLPDRAAVQRFRDAVRPALDDATWRRARGWAIWRALGCLSVGEAGRRGEPGGKPSWGPPALRSLRLLLDDPAP